MWKAKSKLHIVLIALFVALTLLHKQGLGQEEAPNRKLAIETNPLAFAFKGWSAGVAYHPPQWKHWVFNAGAYSFELPKFFVDQIPGNTEEGWGLQITTAVTAGADYYPWREDRSGLAFGMAAVWANFEVSNQNNSAKAEYSSLYFVPRASYTWFIYEGLYLMPWLGVEFHNKINGDTQVGDLSFEPISVQFSPNLTVGYAIN